MVTSARFALRPKMNINIPMQTPVTTAVAPDFMHFRVGATELNFSPVHGRNGELQRGMSAALHAMLNQRIMSEKASLDQCKGELWVLSSDEPTEEWAGSIRMLKPHSDRLARFRDPDYAVYLELQPMAFDHLMAMFQTGQELFGLMLNFEDIDWPGVKEPEMPDNLWDDVQYPQVKFTRFTLRWKPQGGPALPCYSWP